MEAEQYQKKEKAKQKEFFQEMIKWFDDFKMKYFAGGEKMK